MTRISERAELTDTAGENGITGIMNWESLWLRGRARTRILKSVARPRSVGKAVAGRWGLEGS